MNKEFEEIKESADSLKRSLIELELNLDYFGFSDSEADRDNFIDCKIQQLDALEDVNNILRMLKSIDSKLKDS